MTSTFDAAVRLHGFLHARSWDGRTLGGPDQGVRWHIRIGRFVESYFPLFTRPARYVFQQGQGYWTLSNWLLFELSGEPKYRDIALAATRATAAMQLSDGSWPYPLPERRHLKATVEGIWGALTLLHGYARTGERSWKDKALQWHRFLLERIGFQDHDAGRAVNYFDQPRGKVPNNSVSVIWMLGEYRRILGEPGEGLPDFFEPVPAMLTFLEATQMESGEFPYELSGPYTPRTRRHYLCYQYNAFECMRLISFGQSFDNLRALSMAKRLARYLSSGVLPSGACMAECTKIKPEVVYYAGALGMALYLAHRAGLGDYDSMARRCFQWVIGQQRTDGGMLFSRGDYKVLSDRNPYPRYLAMTLYHLLLFSQYERAAGNHRVAHMGGL